MQTVTLDATINDLASRMCCVVHARDLREAGIDRGSVRRRIAAGTMSPMLPRTYAVGPQCQSPTFEMHCAAGVLSAGRGSRVDGVSAAALLDVWDRHDRSVHVATPCAHAPTPPPWVFHRTAPMWVPSSELAVGALPIVGFEDLCLRMAATHTKWQVAFVIGRGMYRQLTTLDRLERFLARHCHVIGVETLRQAIRLVRDGSAGSRSPAEDATLDGLVRAGAPEPIVNTKGVLGMPRDEPDFVWHSARLNVEIDGRQHDDPVQAADDVLRDAEVARRGYTPVRIHARDVYRRPSRVIGFIMRALAGQPIRVDPVTRYAVL